MQEYWEKYVKPMDGHPSLVSFNAGVSDNFQNMELGYVGFVKVLLHQTNSKALIIEEEEDDIIFLENQLEMESLRYRIGKYIGRIITQGSVNFIYYLKYDFEWENVVNATMKHCENYNFEFGSRVDTEWEVYQKLLFPTSQEWQIIQNHHTCDQLKEAGDNLRLKRAIEHEAYFKTIQDRDEYIKYIENEDFHIQKEIEATENGALYGLRFYRIGTPYYYEIDELTLWLIKTAQEYNGQYDGWETSLVKI